MGKNLLVNNDFICSVALMNGDETKQFLIWSYDYMVNGNTPIEEELDSSSERVYNAFNKYIQYMDWCTRNYKPKHTNNEIELDSEFESELEKQRTQLLREINAKKDELVVGNFKGKIKPKYKFLDDVANDMNFTGNLIMSSKTETDEKRRID